MGLSDNTESIIAVYGCTNPAYQEYNPEATADDGSCVTFNFTATSAEVTLPGYVDWEFTDSSTGGAPTEWLWDLGDQAISTEQNPTHRYTESGQYVVTMTASNEWGSSEITQDVEIEIDIPGCTDPAYQEYNSTATIDDGSCLSIAVSGCMNDQYQEYNPDATMDDGTCVNLIVTEIRGCMDPAYQEYNPEATVDNGMCRTLMEDEQALPGDIPGCMDPAYQEYNPDATMDDGTCRNLIYIIPEEISERLSDADIAPPSIEGWTTTQGECSPVQSGLGCIERRTGPGGTRKKCMCPPIQETTE